MSDLRYKFNPTAGVVIPGAQAIVSAIAGGAIGYTAALVFGWPDPATIGAAAAAVTFGAAWAAGLAWWRSTIQPEPELAPIVYPTEVARLKLAITWNDGRAGLFDELNISDALFIQWACGVGSGKSLGENHWCGSANPFSKGQYHNFIDKLVELGIVKQAGKGKSSGYELTGKGAAVCRGILARYGNTSPAEVKYLSSGI